MRQNSYWTVFVEKFSQTWFWKVLIEPDFADPWPLPNITDTPERVQIKELAKQFNLSEFDVFRLAREHYSGLPCKPYHESQPETTLNEDQRAVKNAFASYIKGECIPPWTRQALRHSPAQHIRFLSLKERVRSLLHLT